MPLEEKKKSTLLCLLNIYDERSVKKMLLSSLRRGVGGLWHQHLFNPFFYFLKQELLHEGAEILHFQLTKIVK